MVRISISGLGDRMTGLLRLVFESCEDISIDCVYDPDKEKITEFIKEFGSHIKVADNFESMASHSDCDWVFIGSPNSSHKDQILVALKNEKHIFCEKPIAISIEECLEIKKAFKDKKLNFIISYPLRYSILYKKAKDYIDSGILGDIVSIDFNEILSFQHGAYIMDNWRKSKKISGGHLLEKCCHDIDLINWFIGDLPKKVSSFGDLNFFVKKNEELFENHKKLFPRERNNPFKNEKDVVDNQVAIIEFFGGTRASFHTNCSSAIPQRVMNICGSKGSINMNLVSGDFKFKDLSQREEIIKFDEKAMEGHGGGDKFLVKNLLKVIKKIDFINDLDDAIKSAVTAIKIDEARETGKVIDLGPTWELFGLMVDC